jgi:hypothetical protein
MWFHDMTFHAKIRLVCFGKQFRRAKYEEKEQQGNGSQYKKKRNKQFV